MLLDVNLYIAKRLLPFMLALLTACGTGSGINAPETIRDTNTEANGLNLPTPSAVRQLSAEPATSPFSYATQFDMDLPYSRVSPSNGMLQFIPEKDFDTGKITPAYAMYRLSVPDYAHESMLQVGEPWILNEKAWVGFANFERDRWDWQPFQDELSPLFQNTYNPDVHVNNNEILVAIVATSIVSLDWLAAGDLTKPYLTDVQPKMIMTGDQVQLSAEFKFSEAETYQWNLGDGFEPSASQDAQPVLTAQEPGAYSGTLSVENALGTDYFNFSYEITSSSELPPLHLEAVPAQTNVGVNEPVLVTIRCGDFPEDEPMSNCYIDLLVAENVSYVPDSYNVGSPGGDRYEIDGIWSLIPNPPTGWLEFADEWLKFEPVGTPGFVKMELPIAPINNGNTTTGGDIINIQLAFSQPGVYKLAFMPNDSTANTFYTDTSGHDFDWYDISNDAAPQITVTE